MKIRSIVTAVVAGGLAAGVIGFLMWPEAVPVDTAKVARGDLAVTVSGEGVTRVRDMYVVSAPIAGRVLRIEGHVGDSVIAGETILARIEPSDPVFLDARSRSQAESAVRAADANKRLAEAAVTRAQAELEFTRSELDRAEALAARDTISPRALERAQIDMRTRQAVLAEAAAALRVRTFELENARAMLMLPDGKGPGANGECCIVLRAPVSGNVLQIMRESEGVVPVGTPLIEIGNPTDLEIVVDLLSQDAVRVREGAPAAIEEWGGEPALNALVRRIEPFAFTKISALGIEEQRVNIILDLADPPDMWRPLGHGYRVEARIELWRDSAALTVPVSALFRTDSAWSVFVVENGVARKRAVEIGRRNAVAAQVISGIEEGETVVVHPGDRVDDGVTVVDRATLID
ncbi:MAG: HlyD family efflux transporter periplasmic adaptor subunit [Proteobacteria bacterium]|nr:HlyD family efflux transporter periplasmic adaptor subunit [Pseudomonadota bacterium]MDA1059230.1 HlyD family efflux transporter periplasmic adaptor subunit [Pseudomonadota bacterium]